MTAHDLSRYVGLEVLWTTGSIDVLCKILQVKKAYGRTRYLITPLSGSRSMWVQDGLSLPELDTVTTSG